MSQSQTTGFLEFVSEEMDQLIDSDNQIIKLLDRCLSSHNYTFKESINDGYEMFIDWLYWNLTDKYSEETYFNGVRSTMVRIMEEYVNRASI